MLLPALRGNSKKRAGYHKSSFLGKSHAKVLLFQIRIISFLGSWVGVSA